MLQSAFFFIIIFYYSSLKCYKCGHNTIENVLSVLKDMCKVMWEFIERGNSGRASDVVIEVDFQKRVEFQLEDL